MHDSPRRDDDELAEIRARLMALEQRLASMEQWVALPPGYPAAAPSEPQQQPPPQQPPPPAEEAQPQPLPPPPLEEAERAEPVEPVEPAAPAAAATPRRRIHEPEPVDSDSPLDFESLIGQNLASWAGGIVLLLGICFFLKYAWDRGWIRPSPQVRVILAVLLGAIVCGLGEWVWRKRMRGLAATLHGTGVAILMTSFFGANRYFDPPVMSRGGAFLGVALSAAVGIFFALRVNVMTVALLSLIGAYISPAILSTGIDKSPELLSYLGLLAAVAWVLSFVKSTRLKPAGGGGGEAANDETRFHWLAVRWIAFAASCIWFFAWWSHFGEENHHHFLAMVWLAFIYCGFLAEAVLTLQTAVPRMPMLLEMPRLNPFTGSFGYPVGPPRADSGLAMLSFVNTTFVFAALYWVLEDEPRSMMALVALAMAAVQAVVAIFTVSRPMMYTAIVQSAALVTLAAPLWFDDFSITLAWMVLALAVAALGWQLNIPAARGWAVALLILATIRLSLLDSSSATMRTAVLVIGGKEITRWLLAAWVIAIQFHLLAWMQPRSGRWPMAERYLREVDDAKLTLATDSAVARRDSTLDYAVAQAIAPLPPPPPPLSSSSSSPHRPGLMPHEIDGPSALLAFIGTAVFAAASAARWDGSALTLVGIIWLTPIVLLEPHARRLGYGPHAAVFMGLIAVHWLLAGNLQPLLHAWERPERDNTAPLFNLPFLNGALLAAAVFTLIKRARLPDADARQVCYFAGASVAFAIVTFETWRFVDFITKHGVGIDNPAMAKQMATSVLWSGIGFACVLVGFWRRLRELRHAALWLLGITLAKIFVVDMKDVKAVWRILSFIALGSLLLGVSYLYHQQQSRRGRERGIS